MDSIPGIITNTPLVGIAAYRAVTPASGLLASDISAFSSGLFGGTSTVVELSGLGQLLSAAATFQDQLAGLQPGTATSGGGQNFGSDVASLAAEAQGFVDAFNSLQNNISAVNAAGGVPGAANLVQALDTQVQASYINGDSTLTKLSQLGISIQPGQETTGGNLSIDLATLESAFSTDAAGAFSLLSQATNAFANLAGGYVAQAGVQSAALGGLAQTAMVDQLLAENFLSPAATSGTFDLAGLLALESLSQPGLGVSAQQAILALNQFALVSTLLG